MLFKTVCTEKKGVLFRTVCSDIIGVKTVYTEERGDI